MLAMAENTKSPQQKAAEEYLSKFKLKEIFQVCFFFPLQIHVGLAFLFRVGLAKKRHMQSTR